jgi:hypothetical protein
VDVQNDEPSIRRDVAELIGSGAAWLLGPYPDEVGWCVSSLLAVSKVVIVATAFWSGVDLFASRDVGDELAGKLILWGVTLTLLGILVPQE